MKLQTNLNLQKQTLNAINYHSKILLLGSCFSENIGQKLAHLKFQSKVNPLGILFHPQAIETFILNSINKKTYTDEDMFYFNERWHNFDIHSSFSNPNKVLLLETLNSITKENNTALKEATHLIITLGTAWVYRHIASDQVVANCHKIEQKKFLKELLSIEEVTESLEAVIALVRSINPNSSILFTVSPVRHLKDGFVENTQSKSHLISGIHKVVNAKNNLHYFPSYELMMDELRDYRFYEEDMVHPNQIAINYIWEKFCASWMDAATEKTMLEIQGVQRDIAHRPFNKNSEQHRQFLNALAAKKESLSKKLPFIKF